MRSVGNDSQALLARLQTLRDRVEQAAPEEVSSLAQEVHSLLEQLQTEMKTSSFESLDEVVTQSHRSPLAGGSFEELQRPTEVDIPALKPAPAREDSQLWPGAGIQDTTAQVAQREQARRKDLLASAAEVLQVADQLLLRAKHPALFAANEQAQQLVARAYAAESRALAREAALLRKKKMELEEAKKGAEQVEGDEWSHASRALMVQAALLAGSLERLQQAYALATELEGGGESGG